VGLEAPFGCAVFSIAEALRDEQRQVGIVSMIVVNDLGTTASKGARHTGERRN
jgi:hypothetical protein